MVALEKNAKVIITDSGGVQKEGFFFGTPCVIPREETEWVELVDSGFNKLAGINAEKIFKLCKELFFSRIETQKNLPEFYGNGSASDKIVSIISGDNIE